MMGPRTAREQRKDTYLPYVLYLVLYVFVPREEARLNECSGAPLNRP